MAPLLAMFLQDLKCAPTFTTFPFQFMSFHVRVD